MAKTSRGKINPGGLGSPAGSRGGAPVGDLGDTQGRSPGRRSGGRKAQKQNKIHRLQAYIF